MTTRHLRHLPVYSTILLSILYCWIIASSLWNYPHCLSYFNESIGGPLNGPNYLLGSNVDWGQDLRYLKWWLEKNQSGSGGCSLAYFGLFDPGRVGLADTMPIQAIEVENLETVNGLDGRTRRHEWAAISICLLKGDPMPARDGSQGPAQQMDKLTVSRLRKMEPSVIVGGSIYVFKLSP